MRDVHKKISKRIYIVINLNIGHDDQDGNLHQLLKLRAEDKPDILKWLQEKHYLSSQIINEIISMMGQDVLRKILVRIREAGYFALLADETRDIANK